MSFRDVDEICEFLTVQIRYIGDHILVPNQKNAEISVDSTKNLPNGGKPEVSQAHCSIDDIAQEHFLKVLLQMSPNSRVIVEEATPTSLRFPNSSEDCYYGDLLDGTNLYGNQSKIFGSSLGYAYKDEMTVGVVYLPRCKLLLHAIKGKGAYINGDPIMIDKSSKIKTKEKIILNSKISEEVENSLKEQGFQVYRPHCSVYGMYLVVKSLAVAYVAKNTTVWDIAPSAFILNEAGGISGRFDGTNPDYSKAGIIEDFIAALDGQQAKRIAKYCSFN